MASPVSAKSQPLHYFSLPHLKWKKNHTNNNHRGRRLSDSSPLQSPPSDPQSHQSPLFDSAPRQSPLRDSASESDNQKNLVPEAEGLKNSFLASSSNNMIDKSDKNSIVTEVVLAGGEERRSKIYIRFGKNKLDNVPEEGKTFTVEGEVEESVPKTWNLRPRRPLRNLSNGNGGTPKIGGFSTQENKAKLPQEIQNRPELEINTSEKKEKKEKFAIALSREEIEEDLFAMTGSKPSRRPKKRAKNVQKQLDYVFPGLWLASITPDSYKVSEAPAKG